MNQVRSFGIALTLMTSLTLLAQQSVTTPVPSEGQTQSQTAAALPPVEQHLKVLSDKLDLTADQQAKIRPIIERMQEEWQNVLRDTNLSDQERHDKMKSVRDKADKQTRPILDKEQKKKLDELEQQSDPELHGNVTGATPPPQ